MTDASALAPFHLDEDSEADGSHCPYLFDSDMEQVADVFERHNAECHGYGWDGLARSPAHSHMPENGDKIQFFGSEAGTFVVTSPDLKALTDLAVLLHAAFHDRELLSHYIQTADPRFLDRWNPRAGPEQSGTRSHRKPSRRRTHSLGGATSARKSGADPKRQSQAGSLTGASPSAGPAAARWSRPGCSRGTPPGCAGAGRPRHGVTCAVCTESATRWGRPVGVPPPPP
ncbi:Imm51 family immunity protein [Streptomyces virginiae]|uniref:Imm51 family immunity protein n=1 Tax=Streptomyces virginiae TaxID=1961 RepID=UPI0036C25200